MRLDIDGQYRFFYDFMNDFPLDELGKTVGNPESGRVHNRLRLSPAFHIGKTFSIFGQIDVVKFDNLYGITTDIGSKFFSPIRSQVEGFIPVDPRHLWVQWISPVGVFRLGQQPSHWGLGIVANNGQTQTGEFAAPRYGDIVERLIWVIPIARPFTNLPISKRLFLAAGFDIVFRDEFAELVKGDLAFQGAFSLFYRQKKDIFAGIYVAIRSQQDQNGSRIDAQAYDLFVKTSGLFAKGQVALDLAFEGAVITGSTTRILNDQGKEGLRIESMGAVGRLALRLPKAGIRVGLELGFASGDNNTDDNVSRLFRFDPDYQPSMILFQRALSAISAHGADRAAEPTRTGFPARGTDQIPSLGRVGNVFYLQPVIAYRPFANFVQALKKTELKVGMLFARAAADLIDPFSTFRAGGVNTTSYGRSAATAQDLGMELNISLAFQYDIWKTVSVKLVLLYGHLFAGAGLTGANGKGAAIDMFQARFVTRF